MKPWQQSELLAIPVKQSNNRAARNPADIRPNQAKPNACRPCSRLLSLNNGRAGSDCLAKPPQSLILEQVSWVAPGENERDRVLTDDEENRYLTAAAKVGAKY
jgi:hypothetical protein